MKKLSEEFFARNSKDVARDIMGRILVRNLYEDNVLSGIITETWPYHGVGKGTKNKEGLFYPPGKIYIMPYRVGVFLNISTDKEGEPSCVFIRKVHIIGETEKESELGPIELCKSLHIDRSFDGKSIYGDDLWIEGPSINSSEIGYVRKDKGLPPNCLGRFYIKL